MRIVLSNASGAWGGVHQVTEDLARGLARRGHELVVFCRPASRLEARLRDVAPLEPILGGMDLSPLALARCARALRRHHPAVAVMLMRKDVRQTAPAAAALGIPVLVRHPNDRPLDNPVLDRVLYGRLAALHVANSEATRRTLLASAPWLPPERVRVIHNAVDPAPFRTAAPAPLGLPPGALAVGFVGRFDERKGVLDLADAWPSVAAALPRAHLVMVGEGPCEAEMRRRLALAPRVHWLGHRTDVPAVMRSLQLLAMPSHWEGFGLVALEALAAGVPVVAARASSLPEIVRDGVEGELVPPRDPGALAAALERLGADPARRARLAAAAPARAAWFNLERMLDGYEAALLEMRA